MTPRYARLAVGAFATLALQWGAPAMAEDSHAADAPPSEAGAERHAIDRTWLYGDDSRIPAPLAAIATAGVSYANVSSSPSRVIAPGDAPAGCRAPCNSYNAFASNTATPGAVLLLGGELGLLSRLSVLALAQTGLGASQLSSSAGMGAVAGLRLQLLPSELHDVRLVLSAGYVREAWQGPWHDEATDTWHAGPANGADGGWGQLAIAGDLGRLRLGATAHVERIFAAGRDGLDVMVQAGASYLFAGPFRAGLEYVGQDLEETFSAAAEGGARHLVGPVASVHVWSDRLSVVSGPAVGLTSRSPDFVYRLQASYGF
jgi:hypothetical protein